MMSIFLILWYLTQLSWDIKGIGKRFFHFVIVSLLSVITSLVMLYPTFLDLRTHGESFSKVDSIFTEKKVGILTYLRKISLEVLTLLNMDQFQ